MRISSTRLKFSLLIFLLLAFELSCSAKSHAQSHFDGTRALEYTRQFVAIGPRWSTSPGHQKAEDFLRTQFKKDKVEEDYFTANTPIGPVPMRNFIVRFPGKKMASSSSPRITRHAIPCVISTSSAPMTAAQPLASWSNSPTTSAAKFLMAPASGLSSSMVKRQSSIGGPKVSPTTHTAAVTSPPNGARMARSKKSKPSSIPT